MTAQHAAARRPWHEAVRDGLRYLRARAAMLAARPSWFRVPPLGCLPLFPATPAPGAAPGQAQDATETPAPSPRAGQDEAATVTPDGAATLPLRAVAPPPPQGQPYADWPQPPLGALVIPLGDGAVEYRRPDHDAIITVRATPGGGTRTEVWTPRRRDLSAELEAAGQPVLVRPAYRRWLAAQAEVTAA